MEYISDPFTLCEKLRNTAQDAFLDAGLEQRGPYGLLDFPNHPNVGDSAIWIGELNYLKSARGRSPSYVCEYTNFRADDLKKLLPEGPIFLHGGGNFGDLWPDHQAFRESVLEQFPERQIIQLPQTIYFQSADNLKRAAQAINKHKNFTLFCRDRAALEIAKSNFSCPAYLAPFFLKDAAGLRRKQPIFLCSCEQIRKAPDIR
jgi:exopolysaccharide biosynthesis predicted pyruvyltransferase EpsI